MEIPVWQPDAIYLHVFTRDLRRPIAPRPRTKRHGCKCRADRWHREWTRTRCQPQRILRPMGRRYLQHSFPCCCRCPCTGSSRWCESGCRGCEPGGKMRWWWLTWTSTAGHRGHSRGSAMGIATHYSTVLPIPLNHQLTAVNPQPVMTAKVPEPVLTVLRGMDCTVGVRTISWVVHTRAISFNKVLALKLGWLAMLALGWVMPPPLRLTVPTTLKVLARVRPTVQWAAVTIQRVLWIHPPQKCALAAERRETM